MDFCIYKSWEWKLEWQRESFEWVKSQVDVMNELSKSTIDMRREVVGLER